MGESRSDLWRRCCEYWFADRDLGLSLDISRMSFSAAFFETMTPRLDRAIAAMAALEAGAIANPDENRQVGHYWLRTPELAPDAATTNAIRDSIAAVGDFGRRVHAGEIQGQHGPFEHLLHIGIGGSGLGPQLLAEALGGEQDRMTLHFLDNTDPDGFDRVLSGLRGRLGRTMVTVVSKSGSTPEPKNAMLETQAAYGRAGLAFERHAVAVTMDGSKLDALARETGWLQRFPIWDWVGGRTSAMSPVGLLPAALQGLDIDAFLDGGRAMDALGRAPDPRRNPAALLAATWYHGSDGRGARDMVILPYKDRLLSFSRYLQQLVMESLGKTLDRQGATVHQGLAVYGNKGSTDQHAYVQQLRDGIHNFFVTFIQVLEDRHGPSLEVEPAVTSGDYLFGFMQGTRQALFENGRESITITLERLNARTLGALIALYDRAVGLYAELIDVNAYHQPGVEAGKKAAAAVLGLQHEAVDRLRSVRRTQTADQIAKAIGRSADAEMIYRILEHLAHNHGRGVTMNAAATPDQATFEASGELPVDVDRAGEEAHQRFAP